MCTKIYVNNGEVEIGTPDQFKEHFGFEAIPYDTKDDVWGDCCLCQVNIEATFEKHNIKYEENYGDYDVEFSRTITR